jgi:hypothetical protein
MWYLRKIGQYNDHFDKSIHGEENIWKYLEENDPNGHTSRFGVEDGKYKKL